MISRNSLAMQRLDAIQSDSGVPTTSAAGVAKLGADKSCFALLQQCYLVEQLCHEHSSTFVHSSTSQLSVYDTAMPRRSSSNSNSSSNGDDDYYGDQPLPAFTQREALVDFAQEMYDAAMQRVVAEPHVVNVLYNAKLEYVPSGSGRDYEPVDSGVQSTNSDAEDDDQQQQQRVVSATKRRARQDNLRVCGWLNAEEGSPPARPTRTTVIIMWGPVAADSTLMHKYYCKPEIANKTPIAYSAWLLTKSGSVYVAHFAPTLLPTAKTPVGDDAQ